MPIYTRVSGTWREIGMNGNYTRVSGTWRSSSGYTRVSGTWRQVHKLSGDYVIGDSVGGGVLSQKTSSSSWLICGPGTSGQNWTSAINWCNSLTTNGYSDWFLPNRTDLNVLYVNRTAIGGFSSSWYWSSTESGSTNAWVQHFGNGNQYNRNKTNFYSVRAVRRLSL